MPGQSTDRSFFDPDRFGSQMQLNAKLASSFDELINEIRFKTGKRTRATVQDRDLRSCTRRDMRELEGDVPASDEENPQREPVQLQELIAGREVARAGNRQISGHLPGRNHDKPSNQCLFPYLHGGGTGEARTAMERGDACFREAVFAPPWNGLGERALETHQLGPIDLKLPGLNAFSFHSTGPVDGFGGADEHFLRIASPQGASAAERPRIDDRDPPACVATARHHRRSG